MRTQARKSWSAWVVMIAGALIAAVAVVYPGFATADVDLNDGGVWVTRARDSLVGHLNYPSRVLDGSVSVTSSEFDLFQDGNDVIVHNPASGSLTQIDPATVSLLGDGSLSPGSRVGFAAEKVGIIDASNDGLYVLKPDQIPGFSATGRDPVAELGPGSAVAVSVTGTVFAVSAATGELVIADRNQEKPTVKRLSAMKPKPSLSITAVGDTPVVLDSANGVLFAGDRSIDLPEAKRGVLQAAGSASSAVIITTPAGLLTQPLDGSAATLTPVAAGGTPAQAVWLAGCAYAVWSGNATYVRDCAADSDDRNETLEGAGNQPTLSLRRNRNVVVVNELTEGRIWLVNDDMTQINNWDDVIPRDPGGEEQSEERVTQFTLPKRSSKNQRPTAENDSYGVRAGATTILPVLENDSDPDGDLLAASLIGEAPADVKVQTVNSGAALQVTTGRNAAGTLSFRYQVDDGRERGTDQAKVTLKVMPDGQSGSPRQKKVHTVQLERGATATFDALMGWTDPEGDDIYLKSAGNKLGDRITHRTNGVVQFTEASGDLGIHEIALVVSDGVSDAHGVLRVDVRPRGSLAPIANADRYSTLAGDRITVAPLANDLSASGKELRLAKLDRADGATLMPDFSGGTFSFEAQRPGTYYVQYLVSDGPNAADGIVRVDVQEAGAAELEPLATRDTALLMPSQEALVDVLANDTDPAGGILVVQSVTVPNGSKIAAEVLEHRVLRVRDNGLSAPATITYRVSNGSRWADAEVRVIPVGMPDDNAAPVTMQDRAVVRAGDIVTVDVTANDYHPAGDRIELLSELKEAPDPKQGVAFVSEGKVRFKAGDADDLVAMVYEVADSKKNVTAGYLRIQVVAPDGEANAAPLPRSVTARAIAGTQVRIPIPVDGIDPDGDSVELVGIDSAPKKGRVSLGDSWLVYEAYAGTTGRDRFDYVVRDRLGASAAGTVVVGIAAPSNQNQAPYTVRDTVTVRPGRSVSVPVLQNDSDPDGDDVGLSSKGLTAPDGVTVDVVKSRLVVVAPTQPGEYSITYTAVDGFGATSLGTLIVTVAPDSPLRAPIARDDRVQAAQVGAEPTVDVVVLDNDEDPDGVAEDLTVTSDDPNTLVRTDGALQVTLTPDPQVILYTVSDMDGQSASAVVFVPGTATLLPTLKPMDPVEVVAGEEIRLALADYVAVRPDRKPRIAEADGVRAGHAGGGSLVADEYTLSYTSDPAYFGPDAVSVLVTDGEGPDDPKGNSAYLSIPLSVLPSENQPPVFMNTSVSVSPGEDPVEVNLGKLASDPDPDDTAELRFEVGNVPAGFGARVEGGNRLLVSADSGTAHGTSADITLRVSDGTTAPTEGTITAAVTSSQRELPVAVNDAVPTAEQGRTVSVDVLRNDHNPFPETPLTVISAEVITGEGVAAVNGGKVDVTPDADFVGTMQVTYRIQDATKAPEREAEATISVTVQGAPDQPTKPIVLTVGNRTVVLQWTPPENNGRPISGYTVTSRVENFSQKCATTTCTLKGLTNDTEYTFQVVATNEIGDSDPSPASAVARPDTRPDTPAPPKLEFGDKSLTVTWQTPHSSGSPVLSFNLEISPAPEAGAMQLTGITGNRFVWKGLRNGTSYQVKVQAVNRAPEPSEWSQYSVAEVPAGPPQAPGRPTTDPATPVGSQAQITVSWPAVTGEAANGDPVKEYTLEIIHGGSSRSVTVNGTRQNVTVDPSTSDYTFRVTATNKAGESDPSPESAPRRAAVPPGAPQDVQADPGDRKVTLTFSAGDLNGSKAGEITYHYRNNQTGATGTIRSGGDVTGLTNGTGYTFDVWATSSVSGVEPGPTATSNRAVPFGKPIIILDGIDRLDNAVRFRWHVDSNGAALTSENPGLDGSGNGTRTVTGLAAGQWKSIDVSYTNKAGTSAATWSGQANDPPPARVWLTGAGGSSVTVHWQSLVSGTRAFRCWEAKNLTGVSGPTNYSWYTNTHPEAGTYTIGPDGLRTITCPYTPHSGVSFSVEIQGAGWSEAIVWP